MKKKLLPLAMLAGLCAMVLFAGTAQAESVVLNWAAPTERNNGEPLTVDELGGYELRYQLAGTADQLTVIVPDGKATTYRVDGLPGGSHVFEIAAYDTNGLYSEFVSIGYNQPSKPGGPGNVGAQPVINDVIAACLADPNCRVAVAGEW